MHLHRSLQLKARAVVDERKKVSSTRERLLDAVVRDVTCQPGQRYHRFQCHLAEIPRDILVQRMVSPSGRQAVCGDWKCSSFTLSAAGRRRNYGHTSLRDSPELVGAAVPGRQLVRWLVAVGSSRCGEPLEAKIGGKPVSGQLPPTRSCATPSTVCPFRRRNSLSSNIWGAPPPIHPPLLFSCCSTSPSFS